MLSNLKFIWLLGKNGDVFAFVVKINIKFGPKHSLDGLHKTLLGLNRDFIVILTLSSLCLLLAGLYRFVSGELVSGGDLINSISSTETLTSSEKDFHLKHKSAK